MKLIAYIFLLIPFVSIAQKGDTLQIPPTWTATKKIDTLPIDLQLTKDGKPSIGYNVQVLCITRTGDSTWIHWYYLNDKKKKVTGKWYAKRK